MSGEGSVQVIGLSQVTSLHFFTLEKLLELFYSDFEMTPCSLGALRLALAAVYPAYQPADVGSVQRLQGHLTWRH